MSGNISEIVKSIRTDKSYGSENSKALSMELEQIKLGSASGVAKKTFAALTQNL